MARIIRCPSCGALWRLNADDKDQVRCGVCKHEFALASAQTVEVPDAALEEALAKHEALEAERKRELESLRADPPEPRMPAQGFADQRARELNAPSAAEENEPAQYDEKDAGMGAPMPAIYRTKKSGFGTALTLIGILVVAVAAAAAAALLMHDFVLAQVPYLRPVYEKVCRQAPCPGFVWSDSNAFKAQASLSADPDAGMLRPSLKLRLTNTSDVPQYLPVLEVKYLGPAGDVLAQRVLEPSDYGFPQQPAVLPAHESLESTIVMKTVLDFAAASATAAPVLDSDR